MNHKHLTIICAVLAVLMCLMTISAAASSWTRPATNKDVAHEVAELMRSKGYEEDNPVILACQDWWQSEHKAEQEALELRIEYTTKSQRSEYPVAATVWQLLRESGLSEPVTAGIIGNMMSECGGHTLDLMPYIYTHGFYGLCMWSLTYFPQVDAQSVPGQIDVLLDTLADNIAAGGGDIDTFLGLTDARAAARYFSDYYERPASWSEKRADNAEAAYKYFTERN